MMNNSAGRDMGDRLNAYGHFAQLRSHWAKSGRQSEFPENDRAEFFDLDVARQKINSAQVSLIDELERLVERE